MKVLLVIWTLTINPSGQMEEFDLQLPLPVDACLSALPRLQDAVEKDHSVVNYYLSCEEYRDA